MSRVAPGLSEDPNPKPSIEPARMRQADGTAPLTSDEQWRKVLLERLERVRMAERMEKLKAAEVAEYEDEGESEGDGDDADCGDEGGEGEVEEGEESDEEPELCKVCLKVVKDHCTFDCPYLVCIPNPKEVSIGSGYYIVCRCCNKRAGHSRSDWVGRAKLKSCCCCMRSGRHWSRDCPDREAISKRRKEQEALSEKQQEAVSKGKAPEYFSSEIEYYLFKKNKEVESWLARRKGHVV